MEGPALVMLALVFFLTTFGMHPLRPSALPPELTADGHIHGPALQPVPVEPEPAASRVGFLGYQPVHVATALLVAQTAGVLVAAPPPHTSPEPS